MFENFFKKIKANLSFIKDKLAFFSELKSLNTIFNVIFLFFIILIMVDENLFYHINQSFINLPLSYINYFSNFYFVNLVLFFISVKNIIYSTISSYNQKQNLSSKQHNSVYLYFIFLVYAKDIMMINVSYVMSYSIHFIKHLLNSNYFYSFVLHRINSSLTPIS